MEKKAIKTSFVKTDVNISHTNALANFVCGTGYEDLGEETVYQTKRLILDTIGCALAGQTLDMGKIVSTVAKGMGRGSEATIIGSNGKVSSACATFANAELANALDADEAFLNFTHIGCAVIPAALAFAEQVGASGKDFITAVALGYDVAARSGLSLALGPRLTGKPPDLKLESGRTADFSCQVFGSSAAAGKLLNLDKDQIATAFGISGINTPLSSTMVLKRYDSFLPMTKYSCIGMSALVGAVSSMLAEQGFTAGRTILDKDFGLWELLGVDGWYPESLVEDLGTKWWINEASYKLYPSCRVGHSALDAFYAIVKRNNLKPDEIQEVTVKLHPRFRGSLDRPVDKSCDAISFQFCPPLNFSMAAFGVVPGPDWQDAERLGDPRIKEFAEKVRLLPDREFLKYMYEEIGNEPRPTKKTLASVEVTKVDGRTFREHREYAKGDPWDESTRLTDGDLKEKFRIYARGVLNARQTECMIDTAYELEKVDNIKAFISLLAT